MLEGEFNLFSPLRTCKLLILRGRKNATNATYAPFGHTWGTRKDTQSVVGVPGRLPSTS